ncbi:MAG TPA: class I SAM-dependent methyltransferase [Candidatus Limnocylindria bacterium]|nr:class I SAM-dependent methyltransferase [Candidatus Limnocylindria bacterium]
MSNATLGLPVDLHEYLLEVGVREPDLLRELRDETAAMPEHDMQIAPEQGALMALLVQLIGARRCVEVGTFTGYSSLTVALALPADGTLVCCDISREWTDVARRYWERARVADKIELRLGPALDTLDAMLAEGMAGTFDFAFLDADKDRYPEYSDRLLALLRSGGLLAIDNVFWGGDVADPAVDDPSVRAIRRMNQALAEDGRVSLAMVPIADGLTLARKR